MIERFSIASRKIPSKRTNSCAVPKWPSATNDRAHALEVGRGLLGDLDTALGGRAATVVVELEGMKAAAMRM